MLSLKQALSRAKALYGDSFEPTIKIERNLGDVPLPKTTYMIYLWTVPYNPIYTAHSYKSFEECFIKLADIVPPKE